MNGLELAKRFYETFGAPMIEEQFKTVAHRIAVGLVGEGSECLGFDDVFSQDHDFDPGFCLWITAEDERKFGFPLERAYARLPKTFEGFTRTPLSPVGGNRHGVLVIEEFYKKFLGAPNAPDTIERWLHTPSATLRTASNGQVWRDDLGIFSQVREQLLLGYPEDVRRKKLAAHLLMLAQTGQYNYPRCKSRGDDGGALLCLGEFIRHTLSVVYLLNNVYEPFYKWAFRGLSELPLLSDIGPSLIALSSSPNAEEQIEGIACRLAKAFCDQGLSTHQDATLTAHAYQITDTIRDGNLRNMHILEGI